MIVCTVTFSRWDEMDDMQKRIQSITEDALKTSKERIYETHHKELNSYRVKIENLFADADDMVLPNSIKE